MDRFKRYLNSEAARFHIIMLILLLGVVAIIARLFMLQLIDANNYKEKAYNQYTSELTIGAKRGKIYDRNMNELATNESVETVYISPKTIKDKDMRKIAEGLSGILDVDKSEIYSKMQKKNSMYQVIKRKVDRKTADNVRRFISENNIESGVHLEDDTKRIYPEDNLASHVIGFTNFDGEGAYGIEAAFNDYLSGTPGKIVTARNGLGNDMPFKYESYIDSVNGNNVVLTIDMNLQSFLEKNLDAALIDTGATNRVFGMILDVNTCEILAMSTKPDYNPNSPQTLDKNSMAEYRKAELDSSLLKNGQTLTQYKSDLLSAMWTNKGVGESYEPGSTFKIITSAMALEEGLVSDTESFNCTGVVTVADYDIKCHNVHGHGVESFEQGLQNSCNPVFMTLAKRLGRTRFYNYFELFGMKEKTGVDLPAEARPIYHQEFSNFNEVELAVYSFGQTFKVTPISLLSAVSSVANGGKLMRPHIVKKIVDEEGNTIESFEPELLRTVCSEETSKKIMEYLANGITIGSTKNAYVKGYSIAAKTGTSQKRDKVNPLTGEKDLYIGSCVAFAPADDPQIAVLVIIDEPQGDYYGGTIAAPVVGSILSDILPYLGVEQTEDAHGANDVRVLDYKGQDASSVKKNLSESGIKTRIIGNGTTVTDQYPKAGSIVSEGGVVALYVGDSIAVDDVVVPDVVGKSAAEANRILVNEGLNISIVGMHIDEASASQASKQSPEAGEKVKPGTIVTVNFISKEASD